MATSSPRSAARIQGRSRGEGGGGAEEEEERGADLEEEAEAERRGLLPASKVLPRAL